MKRLAVFDVDGTLADGFGGIDFVEYLTDEGTFPKRVFDEFIDYAKAYEEGRISYNELMLAATEKYCEGMAGLPVKEVKEAAKKFSEKNAKNIYPYAKELIELFGKEYGYTTVLVSGSAIEVVEPFRRIVGADIAFASAAEHDGKKYIGKMSIDMSANSKKADVLYLVAEKYRTTFDGSFGFGDTENDIPMLEEVWYPVALNPSNALREHADEKGWLILKNGDDVVGAVRDKIRMYESCRLR